MLTSPRKLYDFKIDKNNNNRNNKIQENKNKIIKKAKRNYGIDLLRFFSMINVINLHINMLTGVLKNNKTAKYKTAWLLDVFSFFAVDCIGLISGYVGFRRYRFSNLIYIWFIVWFYSVSISLYLYYVYKSITKQKLIKNFFPILIKRGWYINAYFSMYLFLPFINYGINLLDRKVYRNLIIFFITFFLIYNCFAKIYGNADYHFLNNGYSSKWLAILYIIGAYYGKYYNEAKFGIISFIVYLSIYICSSIFSFEFKFSKKLPKTIPRGLFINFLSPTMIFQSLSLLAIFSRIKIKNKLLTSIISFITPLNFSVYIIHLRLFKEKTKYILKFSNYINSIRQYIFFKYYGLAIIIYIICIFIDYIRSLIFKLLRIRKISLLLEKKVPELFEKLLHKLKIE